MPARDSLDRLDPPSLDDVLGDAAALYAGSPVEAEPRAGRLDLEADDLLEEPSGNLFALTQNVAMGAAPGDAGRPPFLVLSTQGGLRAEDGTPVALGYHTGHWEVGLLVRAAAETLRAHGALPFAAAVSDPCDGRTQGTEGMMDSLAYRNDAAIVLRRLIRSLPTRRGVMAVGTCDKGLPAMLLALAGATDLPGLCVPGGVTLPARGAEDAGTVQSIGARFAHGLVDVEHAATMGCQACGSAGGGCQFLGTAATSQVVAEALGLTLPHAALAPSGTPVWLDLARRSALALLRLALAGTTVGDVLTDGAVRNAMVVHAAFGGSTNLILHLTAVAREAGLRAPVVDDWIAASRATPRLVDALPNGPRNHPTVLVHLAGGVPEVLLHLRALDVVDLEARTVTGQALGDDLAWWETSDERTAGRERLREAGVDPDDVIAPPATARARGLAPTLVFPVGNLAPEGSVVKATAIDAATVDGDVFRHRGPARVFTSGVDAMRALKSRDGDGLRPGDVLVLAGAGPLGTGMAEIASITIALKLLPWGQRVAVVTDGRFSGVSTGPCVGHVSPEALAGGPIGRLRDGDLVEIVVDRRALAGSVDLVGVAGKPCTPAEAARVLAERDLHPAIAPHPRLPADTRLWALLQSAGGGVWGGCHYDVEEIAAVLEAGLAARAAAREGAGAGVSVAIVTGAAQGIGRAVCATLAGDGWDVVLNDLDTGRAAEAAAELGRQAPGRVLAHGGDIADPATAEALVELATGRLGGLDAAVANAGVTTFGDFLQLPRAEIERLLAVNVLGTWQTAQAAARAMASRGGGSLVLLSSVVGLRAVPGLAAYGMTKAAIAGLARSLAVELGPHGIRVNAVAPGATVTERTLAEQPAYADDWARETPLGRTGDADDVAGVVRFLLGPDGRHVSGQTLVVDGGWTGRAPVPPGY